MPLAPRKPLSALLSQTLVAYTVELDCEFERRMLEMQSPNARLSLVIWLNLLRFLADGPISVRTLASHALTGEEQVKLPLGCLERWGFIQLQPGKRVGFGSSRGIRADWPIRLTTSGQKAINIWPELIPEIEARWSLQARIQEERGSFLLPLNPGPRPTLGLRLRIALSFAWVQSVYPGVVETMSVGRTTL